jgi:hypothetical protein
VMRLQQFMRQATVKCQVIFMTGDDHPGSAFH